MEIDRLRAELHQSSDRETNICAKGRKAIKNLEHQLQAKVATHKATKEEYEKLREESNKKDVATKGLRELADKKKTWYEEKLVQERA